MHSVTIPGQPVGKGRPRFTRNGHTYTPNKTADWEARAVACIKALGGQLETITDPVRVYIVAVAARPKRLMRKKDPPGRLWRAAKPDIDNVVKAALDAMVLAEAIRDDIQVVDVRGQSLYTAKDEAPRVVLTWELASELPF